MSATVLAPTKSAAVSSAAGLGARAAARREELGLTQAELAHRIGLSREWIIRFERGNPGANLEGVLKALAELQLEVSTKVSPASRTTRKIPVNKSVAPVARPTRSPHTIKPRGKEVSAVNPTHLIKKPLNAAPPYVVAESLDRLHGPDHGEVSLPKRILWNPSRPFNLADDKRAATMLRLVLLEARKSEDLEELVNPRLLKRLWSRVRLPEYIRGSWEQRFPELAECRELARA